MNAFNDFVGSLTAQITAAPNQTVAYVIAFRNSGGSPARDTILRKMIQLYFCNPVPQQASGIWDFRSGHTFIRKNGGENFFDEPFDFGIYPQTGEVALRLYSSSAATIRNLRRKIKKLKNFNFCQ